MIDSEMAKLENAAHPAQQLLLVAEAAEARARPRDDVPRPRASRSRRAASRRVYWPTRDLPDRRLRLRGDARGRASRRPRPAVRCLVLPDDDVDPGNRFPTQVVRGDLRHLGQLRRLRRRRERDRARRRRPCRPRRAGPLRDVNVRGTANLIEFASAGRSGASSTSRRRRRSPRAARRLRAVEGGGGEAGRGVGPRLHDPAARPWSTARTGRADFRSLVVAACSHPARSPRSPGGGRARLQPVYIGDSRARGRARPLQRRRPRARPTTSPAARWCRCASSWIASRPPRACAACASTCPMAARAALASRRLSRLACPSAAYTPDALLGLAEDADLDHTRFREECGYAPLTLEQGFARRLRGGEAVACFSAVSTCPRTRRLPAIHFQPPYNGGPIFAKEPPCPGSSAAA